MSIVPHLTTALTGSLLELEKKLLNNQPKIECWYRGKWQQSAPPFYGSVDVRNCGYKLAPVDMNLYPGGFNNINLQFIPLAVNAVNNMLSRLCPNTSRVLLIPENHTRNKAYLHNVYTLYSILQQAGLDVAIGSLSPEITEPISIKLDGDKKLYYQPISRVGDRIKTFDGFDPELILLNNDLSSGKPAILDGIMQKLLPPLNAGWYMRKKTNFFAEYDKVCAEFAKVIDIDQWQLNPYFDICQNVDFANQTGLQDLADKVDIMLNKIRIKYQEYNIKQDPYVIVKANNGTYGMGIMKVKSSAEVLSINRKTRNKMSVVKDGQSVHEVIIQEGVYTFEQIEGSTAEAVIYMIDNAVIGGFYRVHPSKANDENLNSIGAHFVPLSFATNCLVKSSKTDCCPPNRFYAYSVIARLSLLASSLELQNHI